MTYYIVEIHEETNRPGDYIHKQVCKTEEEARKFVNDYFDNNLEDFEESETNEWDDSGDNWERILTLVADDMFVIIDKVDND